jgi:hypothetical protein
MDLCAGAVSIPTVVVAQRGFFRILLGSVSDLPLVEDMQPKFDMLDIYHENIDITSYLTQNTTAQVAKDAATEAARLAYLAALANKKLQYE